MPTIRQPTDADRDAAVDYDAEDILLVSRPDQFRAIADGVRAAVVARLRERARSIQQLSEELGIPKGTVGHHVKVLERAGLIRVVRTRQVRAVTEKFYGRTARFFAFQIENPEEERAVAATLLHQAASEVERAPSVATFGHSKARLAASDARRMERRLKRLLSDVRAADRRGGRPFALAAALYERGDA